MPLLLLDLDNTLLDRVRAFRLWAQEFIGRLGAPDDDVHWLEQVDADGTTARWDVAEAIQMRYGVRRSTEELVEVMRTGVVANTRLDPMVAAALRIAGDADWVPIVITNGTTRQQEAKIRRTGLDRFLADWIISDEVGVSKPDPRIFMIAAERLRMGLGGAWMVGDSPEADIGGACAVGLDSVWVHRGRRWLERRYAPTCTADGPIAALAAVMERHRGW